MKKGTKILFIFSVAVAVLAGSFLIYTGIYYKADENAKYTLENGALITTEARFIVFEPEENIDMKTALVFYPGGKVEAYSYAPLMQKLAERGITSILVKMPFNLAVFGINSADRIYNKFPDIESWFIGGHSLGGAMAGSYADRNSDLLDGVILLGAYTVNEADVPTIEIYGSEDGLLDFSKLGQADINIEIEGGNHAYFGDYGEQKGDGTALITREEQQDITIESILDFMQKGRE